MIKLLSSVVLAAFLAVPAFADAECNPMTGQKQSACSVEELGSACERISYDSDACITACKEGKIGQQSPACQEVKKMNGDAQTSTGTEQQPLP